MKLGKTAWFILGVGIFVIAFVALYSTYMRQSSEQDRLKLELQNRLAVAQTALPLLLEEKQALESQLDERKDELAAAQLMLVKSQAKFPPLIESIDYDETLFNLAHKAELEVAELTTSEPKDEKVGGVTFQVTTLVVKVQAAGTPPMTVEEFEKYIDDTVLFILKFINSITVSAEFKTATTELVEMTNLLPPSLEEIPNAEKPGASVKIAIYSYKGE